MDASPIATRGDASRNRFKPAPGAGADDGGAAAAAVRAPAPVPSLGGVRIVRIAAGLAHTAACCEAGGAYAWGWNSDGQLVSSGCSCTEDASFGSAGRLPWMSAHVESRGVPGVGLSSLWGRREPVMTRDASHLRCWRPALWPMSM